MAAGAGAEWVAVDAAAVYTPNVGPVPGPENRDMKIKIIIGVLVALPVLAHLGYAVANSTTTNYYVTVDEYAARSSSSPVRVGGSVVPGSIQWDNATQTMRFQIAGNQSTLKVLYRGRAPDAFRDGVTTILEGARNADGSFTATGVAVRCPHQYLPAG